MAIPYQTTKFKSANILVIAIWDSTAKFNSHQYFQLYGTLNRIIRCIRLTTVISYIHMYTHTHSHPDHHLHCSTSPRPHQPRHLSLGCKPTHRPPPVSFNRLHPDPNKPHPPPQSLSRHLRPLLLLLSNL